MEVRLQPQRPRHQHHIVAPADVQNCHNPTNSSLQASGEVLVGWTTIHQTCTPSTHTTQSILDWLAKVLSLVQQRLNHRGLTGHTPTVRLARSPNACRSGTCKRHHTLRAAQVEVACQSGLHVKHCAPQRAAQGNNALTGLRLPSSKP